MIHIFDDYYIKVSPYSYDLIQQTGTDKEGNAVYKTYGYFSSIDGALKRLVRILVDNSILEKKVVELKQAISLIICATNKITAITSDDEEIKANGDDAERSYHENDD